MAPLVGAGTYIARRAVFRILPWTWPLWVARGAYEAYDSELTPRQRTRLRNLLVKGMPCPTTLSRRERTELRNLLLKVSPLRLAHYVAAEASPLPWPQSPGG